MRHRIRMHHNRRDRVKQGVRGHRMRQVLLRSSRLPCPCTVFHGQHHFDETQMAPAETVSGQRRSEHACGRWPTASTQLANSTASLSWSSVWYLHERRAAADFLGRVPQGTSKVRDVEWKRMRRRGSEHLQNTAQADPPPQGPRTAIHSHGESVEASFIPSLKGQRPISSIASQVCLRSAYICGKGSCSTRSALQESQ